MTFLASRCLPYQDVPSIKMSSASNQLCQAVWHQLGHIKMSYFDLV